MISCFIQKVIYIDYGIVSVGQWEPFQVVFCALYMSSSFFMDFIVLPAQCSIKVSQCASPALALESAIFPRKPWYLLVKADNVV